MTPTAPDTFDDPRLKAAVRRAWGDETAPAGLRDRIAAMGIGAAGAPARDITPPPAARRAPWARPLRHPRPVYGVAAVVAMAIGFAVAYQVDQPPAWRSPVSSLSAVSTQSSSAAVPASLASDLVTVHERCVRSQRHQAFNDVAGDDFEGLRRRLQAELRFPVLAAPIGAEPGEWDFRGGAVCPVQRTAAAHLVFVRKGQAVSIFSLPRSTCPDAHAGDVYEDRDPDHPMLVYVREDGVQCVVGSSDDRSLSPEQLGAICERLRPYLNR